MLGSGLVGGGDLFGLIGSATIAGLAGFRGWVSCDSILGCFGWFVGDCVAWFVWMI